MFDLLLRHYTVVVSIADFSSQPYADPVRKLWTGDEYDRAVTAGLFDRQPLELIEGEIYRMSPMNEPHAQAVRLAQYALQRRFSIEQYTVQIQCPMRLGERSRPEPDVALLAGAVPEMTGHPTTALLIIEVSDSTLEFDSQEKFALYAKYRIADYWIVNLRDRILHVNRQPAEKGYLDQKIYSAADAIAPLADPLVFIRVSDLFP